MTCYGCEVWPVKRDEQREFLTLEMDCLRSARVTKLQKMQAEQSILDRIQGRQLK